MADPNVAPTQSARRTHRPGTRTAAERAAAKARDKSDRAGVIARSKAKYGKTPSSAAVDATLARNAAHDSKRRIAKLDAKATRPRPGSGARNPNLSAPRFTPGSGRPPIVQPGGSISASRRQRPPMPTPPGLAKRAAGAQSARGFAPGQQGRPGVFTPGRPGAYARPAGIKSGGAGRTNGLGIMSRPPTQGVMPGRQPMPLPPAAMSPAIKRRMAKK